MEASLSKKAREPIEIKVEVGVCSHPSKAEEIAQAFRNELSRLKKEGIEKWSVITVGCRGLCFKAPLVEVKTPLLGKKVYQNVKGTDVSRIVVEHIIKGKPVERLIADHLYQPFLSHQERRVLRNCGEIEPDTIESYREAGGYNGLEKALKEMSPDEVLREIKEATLKDRDSRALLTGGKLESYKKHERHLKYLICSGEGEASEACITIALMEGNPFALIEGMTIAAYCVPGVTKGYIFHKKEVHPLVIRRMENAVRTAREKGLLGKGIMGTSFEFDLELKANGEEFHPKGNAVCCKECAQLLGEPGVSGTSDERPLYVKDFESLWQLNNVFNAETLATLPLIIDHGGSWFKAVGTTESPGTKIFSLVGDVKQAGLVEVPYGTTLSQILDLFNNDRNAVKAFMLGGLGGGFLPQEFVNTPLDHSNLKAVGSRVGSGKILIMDQTHSIIDMTRYAVQKMIDESCERCHPCVRSLTSMVPLLNKIAESQARTDDLVILKQIAETLKENALCEFGKLAPIVILSGLNYFEEEYKKPILQ